LQFVSHETYELLGVLNVQAFKHLPCLQLELCYGPQSAYTHLAREYTNVEAYTKFCSA